MRLSFLAAMSAVFAAVNGLPQGPIRRDASSVTSLLNTFEALSPAEKQQYLATADPSGLVPKICVQLMPTDGESPARRTILVPRDDDSGLASVLATLESASPAQKKQYLETMDPDGVVQQICGQIAQLS